MRYYRKKIRLFFRFTCIPFRQKILLVEAIVLLLASKMLLMLLPFRTSKKFFKKKEKLHKQANIQLLKDIHLSIERANRIAFWSNVCLVKSFAARFMLQRRGIAATIYLGIQVKEENELLAHAWLMTNGVFVTPRGDSAFKEIYSF